MESTSKIHLGGLPSWRETNSWVTVCQADDETPLWLILILLLYDDIVGLPLCQVMFRHPVWIKVGVTSIPDLCLRKLRGHLARSHGMTVHNQIQNQDSIPGDLAPSSVTPDVRTLGTKTAGSPVWVPSIPVVFASCCTLCHTRVTRAKRCFVFLILNTF